MKTRDMHPLPLPVVIKVGGSLLTLPDLVLRIAQWRSRISGPVLYIMGGGPAADVVRDWSARFTLHEAAGHHLAMHALDVTAALWATLSPGVTAVATREAAMRAWQSGCDAVLQLRQFCDHHEPTCTANFPHTWDSTTDTISAWVALTWPASRLVLAKSIPCPTGLQDDAVDRNFNTWARRLACPITWLNLRADAPIETRWQPALLHNG